MERYHKDSPRSEVAEKTNEITPEGGEEEEELGITSLRKHQVTSIKPPPAQWVPPCLTPRSSGWKIKIDRLWSSLRRGEKSSSIQTTFELFEIYPTSRLGSCLVDPDLTQTLSSIESFLIGEPEGWNKGEREGEIGGVKRGEMLQEQGSSSSRDGAMFGARLPMAFATVDVFDKVTASGNEVL